MTFDRAMRLVGWRESARSVRFFQPVRIEHLFETGYGPVVQIMAAVPHTVERWNLVEPRAFPRSERKTGIGADRDGQNV